MPKIHQPAQKATGSTADALLEFHDDFTELNACTAFLLRSCTAALLDESGMDIRSAQGAIYCSQWAVDRARELEAKLKQIRERERVRQGRNSD